MPVVQALEREVGASEAGLARSPRQTTFNLLGPYSFRPLQWMMMSTRMTILTPSLLHRLRLPQCGVSLHAASEGSATGSLLVLLALRLMA